MNGGYNGGNFQPKPRPVLAEEHKLNPIAEMMIQNKKELKPYAAPGDQANTNTIMVAGNQMIVPVAAMMVTHQLGIPFDHPKMPAMRKLNSQYQDNAYAIVYGTGAKAEWVKDSSFFHIPCHTRYVVNKEGDVKNAENGMDIGNIRDGGWTIEIVPDGPMNAIRKVSTQLLRALAYSKLPSSFTDYGFGTYSHRIDVNMETGELGWIPLPKIQASNNLSGATVECANVQEFITTFLKDFNDKKAARTQLRDFEKGVPIRTNDFTITIPGMEVKAPTMSEPTSNIANDDFAF